MDLYLTTNRTGRDDRIAEPCRALTIENKAYEFLCNFMSCRWRRVHQSAHTARYVVLSQYSPIQCALFSPGLSMANRLCRIERWAFLRKLGVWDSMHGQRTGTEILARAASALEQGQQQLLRIRNVVAI